MNELNDIQKTILRHHACGKRAKDVASSLGISSWIVQYNIRLIYQKLGVVSISHAIAKLSGFTI